MIANAPDCIPQAVLFSQRLLDEVASGRPDGRHRFRKGECKAVGQWVRRLRDRGFIAECGRPTSKLVSRHNGLTRRWRAVDRGYLAKLMETFGEIAKPQPDLFGGSESECGDV